MTDRTWRRGHFGTRRWDRSVPTEADEKTDRAMQQYKRHMLAKVPGGEDKSGGDGSGQWPLTLELWREGARNGNGAGKLHERSCRKTAAARLAAVAAVSAAALLSQDCGSLTTAAENA